MYFYQILIWKIKINYHYIRFLMTAFLNGPALHPNKLQPKIMLSRTIEDILSVTKAATRAVLYNISESNRANRLCTVQYTNLEDYAPTQCVVNIALSQL